MSEKLSSFFGRLLRDAFGRRADGRKDGPFLSSLGRPAGGMPAALAAQSGVAGEVNRGLWTIISRMEATAMPAPFAGESPGIYRLPGGAVCHLPLDGHCMPARQFEARHGLQDISGAWRMPQGLSEPVLESYLVSLMWLARYDVMFDLEFRRVGPAAWKALVAENPELAKVQLREDQPKSVYHAVLGTTSQFALDDIRAFVEKGTEAVRAEPGYMDISDKVERISGHFGWIPSRSTLEKLDAAFAGRSPADPYDDAWEPPSGKAWAYVESLKASMLAGARKTPAPVADLVR
jgi:hypothetical protein